MTFIRIGDTGYQKQHDYQERPDYHKPSASKKEIPEHVQRFTEMKSSNLGYRMDRMKTGRVVVKKVDFGFDFWVLLDRYDATLEEKVRQLYSARGKFQYFLTNLYVFFLSICKDLDFMSWILIMRIGFQTEDTAIWMMLIWSILGWTIGFCWFGYKAKNVYYRIKEIEEKYSESLQLLQQSSAQLLSPNDFAIEWYRRHPPPQARNDYGRRNPGEDDLKRTVDNLSKKEKAEIRKDLELELRNTIMKYKLTYGDPDGRKVYTVPQWFNIIPMFGVMTLLNFYIQENHDDGVARLFRASALRTLILVNTWSTVAITIPCSFVISWRFTFGGTSFSDADMFSYFSIVQAVISILLTFTAMGMPGFEDTVVRILKDADEISSDRALAQSDNRTMYAYFRSWHKKLAVLLSHFRVAEIGQKKSNKRVIPFPEMNELVPKMSAAWEERLNRNWVLGLMTRVDKLGLDLEYLPDKSGNIYQEKYLHDAIIEVQDTFYDDEFHKRDNFTEPFWRSVAKLYAISTVLITDAADRVLTYKTLLSLEKDTIESKVESSFLKLTRAAEYKTPLNYLHTSYVEKLRSKKKKKAEQNKRGLGPQNLQSLAGAEE